jgi:hypothetical protein
MECLLTEDGDVGGPGAPLFLHFSKFSSVSSYLHPWWKKDWGDIHLDLMGRDILGLKQWLWLL